MNVWIKIASLLMFFGVILGAFGAHALKEKVTPYQMDVYKTASYYHMIHALGLFVVAWVSTQTKDPKVFWAGLFLVAGIVLFSGSLYIIGTTEFRKIGMMTPFGGLAFLIGWTLLFFSKVS